MLVARTAAEAHLYVDLECEAVGETPLERSQKPAEKRQIRERISYTLYTVRCASGKLLEFEFQSVPAEPRGLRREISYGGRDPSQIIDAGMWLMLADRRAREAPKSVAGLNESARKSAKHTLEDAIACVEEVIKFIPSGQSAVSSRTLFSDRGKTYFNKDVRRFERSALDASLDELRGRIRRLSSARV